MLIIQRKYFSDDDQQNIEEVSGWLDEDEDEDDLGKTNELDSEDDYLESTDASNRSKFDGTEYYDSYLALCQIENFDFINFTYDVQLELLKSIVIKSYVSEDHIFYEGNTRLM
jgi:hypothetical protein